MDEPVNALEFLEQLRERNEKHNLDFHSVSDYLDTKARKKGIPIHGQFELTPLCNFSCKMCYVHLDADQLHGQSIFTVDEWKKLMHQAWEAGMFQCALTGGECLTYPGFDELFLYLHNLGCEVSVLTNGFLLDENRIQFFMKHMPSSIQITLYGWNDDVYERVTGQRAFHTVADNIRKAIEAKLPVSISVTPSIYLGDDVLETIRIARGFCSNVIVNSVIFSPREETGRSRQQDDPDVELYVKIYRLLDELDGFNVKQIPKESLPPAGGPFHECKECGVRCGGGRSGFVVDWQGNMMPCNRLSMYHGRPFEEGFETVWKRINQGASCLPQVPECIDCPYDDVCDNCAANMLRFAEPGKQPKELCERTKYFVQNGVRYISECE